MFCLLEPASVSSCFLFCIRSPLCLISWGLPTYIRATGSQRVLRALASERPVGRIWCYLLPRFHLFPLQMTSSGEGLCKVADVRYTAHHTAGCLTSWLSLTGSSHGQNINRIFQTWTKWDGTQLLTEARSTTGTVIQHWGRSLVGFGFGVS